MTSFSSPSKFNQTSGWVASRSASKHACRQAPEPTLGDATILDRSRSTTWTCYDHYVVVPVGESCPDCVDFVNRNYLAEQDEEVAVPRHDHADVEALRHENCKGCKAAARGLPHTFA